jgi:hypothetical protein
MERELSISKRAEQFAYEEIKKKLILIKEIKIIDLREVVQKDK